MRYLGWGLQILILAIGIVFDDRQVNWAIATRCEPAEQVDIVRSAWSSALDPRITPAARERGDTSHSKMIIDACKPFGWRDAFPRTSAISQDEALTLQEKWFR